MLLLLLFVICCFSLLLDLLQHRPLGDVEDGLQTERDTNTCVYSCVYIHIYRERERDMYTYQDGLGLLGQAVEGQLRGVRDEL